MVAAAGATGDPARGTSAQPPRIPWWLLLLDGLFGIAAGIVLLAWPGIGLITLAWITGVFLLVDGIFELAGVVGHPGEHRGMRALLGALTVIAGLFLMRHPVAGVVAVALLLGIWLVVLGLVRLADAFGRTERHRIWHALIGVLEVIVGVIITADARIGVSTLALIVGIGFVLRGAGTGSLGWRLRPAHVGRRRPVAPAPSPGA